MKDGNKSQRVRNVIIFGTTPMAVELIRLSIKNGDRVLVIASSEDRFGRLSEVIPGEVIGKQVSLYAFNPLNGDPTRLQEEVGLFVSGSRVSSMVFAWDLFPNPCPLTEPADADSDWLMQNWQISGCVSALHRTLAVDCLVMMPRHWFDHCNNENHQTAWQAIFMQYKDIEKMKSPKLSLGFFDSNQVQYPTMRGIASIHELIRGGKHVPAPVGWTSTSWSVVAGVYGGSTHVHDAEMHLSELFV